QPPPPTPPPPRRARQGPRPSLQPRQAGQGRSCDNHESHHNRRSAESSNEIARRQPAEAHLFCERREHSKLIRVTRVGPARCVRIDSCRLLRRRAAVVGPVSLQASYAQSAHRSFFRYLTATTRRRQASSKLRARSPIISSSV